MGKNKKTNDTNKLADLKQSIDLFDYISTDNQGEQVFVQFEKILKELEQNSILSRSLILSSDETENNNQTCFDLPIDYINEYDNDFRAGLRVDSIEDGLITSLNNLGKVDIEYISKVSGFEMPDVLDRLKGIIFQNPVRWNGCWYKGWETSDEYLSGNLYTKLKIAKEENKKYHGLFKANIDALKSVLPELPDTDEIYITLSSPWVPTDVIDDFIDYLSGMPNMRKLPDLYRTHHDSVTGLWEIPCKTRFRSTKASIRNSETYGTPRMEMLYLLEATLNMRTPTITDEVRKAGSNKKVRVVNQEETMLAIEKQNVLIKTFQDWVWQDEKRSKRLKAIYEETYAGIRKRHFNGSYLTLPGLNPEVKLLPYQKDAVARILFSDNTALFHDVGSGKTYIQIAAGMELRRIGISKKNLYVVPNNLVGQWKSIFHTMYPNANLLVVEPRTFKKEKRNSVLKDIRKNDYDGIIMAYSCFDMLPLSERYYKNFYQKANEKLKEARKEFYSDAPFDRRIKKAQLTLSKIHDKLNRCDYSIYFDDLGIQTMFVDESHNYKNVPIETNIRDNHNISKAGSEKCSLMLDKVRCIQASNGGRGVVFATGTPITNSITDLYVVQKYLQDGELTLLGIQNFDSWVGFCAEKEASYEIDVDTNSYHLVNKFSKFHNLTELSSVLASIADFHQIDSNSDIPEFHGYSDEQLQGSIYFKQYLDDISSRADKVRKHEVKQTDDNLLKITTDGRKAALDMRLVNAKIPEDPFSKVSVCASNIVKIYNETKDQKSTQLVFCDTSTPKKSFNMYDELKKQLVVNGVDIDEIAYIHDYDTDSQRGKLFKAVNEGSIRILIGSTFKLGLGVNVQNKLIAIHHLDLPWRPSDMVQREGRILRQGNENKEVHIFRYITKGSFDAYSWQILETKQRFISQLLSGSLTDRNGADVDETVLNYAEIKALAIGNPKMKKRCEIANCLEHEKLLQKDYLSMRTRLLQEQSIIPDKIKHEKDLIECAKKDKETYISNKDIFLSSADLKALRETIKKAIDAGYERPAEQYITDYYGFKLYVPSYMKKLSPQLIVKGNGKYYLDIASEAGITTRLNNFLENFDKKIADYENAIKGLKQREKGIAEQLSKSESHEGQILSLRQELSKIDKELGLTHGK